MRSEFSLGSGFQILLELLLLVLRISLEMWERIINGLQYWAQWVQFIVEHAKCDSKPREISNTQLITCPVVRGAVLSKSLFEGSEEDG